MEMLIVIVIVIVIVVLVVGFFAVKALLGTQLEADAKDRREHREFIEAYDRRQAERKAKARGF